MDFSARRAGAAGLLLALMVTDADATVMLNLGTDGRARSFQGSVCGSFSAPVFQFGDAIGVGGSLISSTGRCKSGDDWVATEYFFLPEDAKNVVLKVKDFETRSYGVLRLNTAKVESRGDERGLCDGRFDCERDGKEREWSQDGGERDDGREVRVITGFLPGANNSLEIALGGLRPPQWLTGGGFASLNATLSYDSKSRDSGSSNGNSGGGSGSSGSGSGGSGSSGGGSGSGGSGGLDGAIPEPGTLLLLLPGLAAMIAIWYVRRWTHVWLADHSAAARVAARSIGRV